VARKSCFRTLDSVKIAYVQEDIMPSKEKRRYPRHDVPDLEGCLLFSMDVDVVNMSLSGMAIETTARVEMGKSYAMKLRHDTGQIPLAGRVVWCHLDRTRRTNSGDVVPVYRSGIQFKGVLTDRASELRSFLRHNVAARTDQRVFGRFPLNAKDVVDLSCEYPFVIKRVSLSGMLIETDLVPEVDSVFDMEMKVEKGTVHTKGRVAFIKEVRENEEHPMAKLGVEFLDMPAGDQEILQDLVERHSD
jgi:hypothetical protein